jgi:uncharacterized protein (TIGR02147 family)
MINLYEYLDYRDYLAEHYAWNKKQSSFFSYRYVQQKTGLDASFYVKVLQKQRHIAEKNIDVLSRFLQLSSQEIEYFNCLVHFNKSKRDDQSKFYFEKLFSLKTPGARTLDKDKYDYFTNWYTIPIREMLAIRPFSGNFKELSLRLNPPITEAQAKKAIKTLENLELVRKNSQGIYEVTDAFLTTDSTLRSIAVRNFQREMGRLGIEAIERFEPEKRDISTLTVSTSQANQLIIKERINEMRREIMKLVEQDNNPEEVFQFNIQIFPLTDSVKNESVKE